METPVRVNPAVAGRVSPEKNVRMLLLPRFGARRTRSGSRSGSAPCFSEVRGQKQHATAKGSPFPVPGQPDPNTDDIPLHMQASALKAGCVSGTFACRARPSGSISTTKTSSEGHTRGWCVRPHFLTNLRATFVEITLQPGD